MSRQQDSPTWRRLLMRQAWIIAMLIALVGSLVVVAVVAFGAASSDCVNDSLGTRNRPSYLDNKAHIAEADALVELFSVPATATPDEQAAALEKFRASLDKYKKQLATDQAFRDAHPLGKC